MQHSRATPSRAVSYFQERTNSFSRIRRRTSKTRAMSGFVSCAVAPEHGGQSDARRRLSLDLLAPRHRAGQLVVLRDRETHVTGGLEDDQCTWTRTWHVRRRCERRRRLCREAKGAKANSTRSSDDRRRGTRSGSSIPRVPHRPLAFPRTTRSCAPHDRYGSCRLRDHRGAGWPQCLEPAVLRSDFGEKFPRVFVPALRACLQLMRERIGIGRRTFDVSDTRGIPESVKV